MNSIGAIDRNLRNNETLIDNLEQRVGVAKLTPVQKLQRQITIAALKYFEEADPISTNKKSNILHQVELIIYQAVLRYTHGNKSKTAALVGRTRTTIRKYYKTGNHMIQLGPEYGFVPAVEDVMNYEKSTG